MKMDVGVKVALVATLVFAMSGVGCSGWKVSNPFSRKPDASHAQEPKELKELDELNDITPPPENYTSNDSAATSEKTSSLAQRGKYEADSEEPKRAEVALKVDEKPVDNFKTTDYSQSYQTLNPSVNESVNALAGGVGSTQQGTLNLPAETTQPAVEQTYAAQQPTVPAQPQANPIYNSPVDAGAVATNAPFPSADPSFPTVDASFPDVEAPFPSAPMTNDLYAATPTQAPVAQTQATPNVNTPAPAYNPIAKVSGAAVAPNAYAQQNTARYPQTQAPAAVSEQEPAVGLAYNFDAQQLPSAPQYNAPANNSLDSDSNPYSNVIYEPQNVSGGVVPGSSIY